MIFIKLWSVEWELFISKIRGYFFDFFRLITSATVIIAFRKLTNKLLIKFTIVLSAVKVAVVKIYICILRRCQPKSEIAIFAKGYLDQNVIFHKRKYEKIYIRYYKSMKEFLLGCNSPNYSKFYAIIKPSALLYASKLAWYPTKQTESFRNILWTLKFKYKSSILR